MENKDHFDDMESRRLKREALEAMDGSMIQTRL